jgi:excisionase family DNA binding protein
MTPDELRSRNFITVQQAAADVFHVDERTIRRGIEEGQIPAVKIGTKTLISAPQLAEMIAPTATPGQVSLAAVNSTGPDMVAMAAEILRGALRALEALTSAGYANGPVPPDQAAANDTARHQHVENG